MRAVKDKNLLGEFCESFCRIVEKHCKYIIVSGFVAIATGRVRGTEDIDMIMEKIGFDSFKKLHEDLKKSGFICVQSDDGEEIYREYLLNQTSVRYIKKNRPVPDMEIKFPKDLLDQSQLQDRTKIKITNLDVWFSSIESNIAFKEEYLKSDKDLEDARHLRILFEDKISEDKIRKIKQNIRKFRK